MPAAVYACDREGVITYYNPKVAEIWGQTPDLDAALVISEFAPNVSRGRDSAPTEDAPVKRCWRQVYRLLTVSLLSSVRTSLGSMCWRISRPCVTPRVSYGCRQYLQDITELKQIQQEREGLLQNSRDLIVNFRNSPTLFQVCRRLFVMCVLTQILARRHNGSQEDSSHLVALIEQAADGMERRFSPSYRMRKPDTAK
jgi:PAS domain-containing protein